MDIHPRDLFQLVAMHALIIAGERVPIEIARKARYVADACFTYPDIYDKPQEKDSSPRPIINPPRM
jgi:hypothetical protein